MKNVRMGYLVEYLTRSTDLKYKVLCSQEKLVEMLQKKYSYSVVRANKIDITEYLLNHEDEMIEVID